MKTQFKCVSDKYLGDGAVKDGTLKLIVNPGDIVEIDTKECTIKNITTGVLGRQRNRDMILGNKEQGLSPMIERLKVSLHYEEVGAAEKAETPEEKPEEAEKETPKRGPGRPPASANNENKGG